MSEHSQGRLIVGADAFDNEGYPKTIIGLDGTHFTVAVALDFGVPGRREANARRLAAAWNFVDGIPTEELEKAVDVAGYVSAKTMLTGIVPGGGGVDIGFEGGACAILAASFAEQFVKAGATNYLELRFTHHATGPLLVTLQRVEGKTPAALRHEAEKERDEAQALLAQIVNGSLGDQMRWKLERGQSTDTDEGRAWMKAFEQVKERSGS